MPDTAANQAAFPQSKNQKPGVGFPLARLVAIISFATGCVLQTRVGSRLGAGSGEGSLVAQMLQEFQPNDLLLGDAAFSSYWLIASLQARGTHYIGSLSASRKSDYRGGRSLGRNDHIVVWKKKDSCQPPGLTKAEWAALPDTIEVRLVRVVVERPGFRTTELHLATTLLDAEQYPEADIADLYRRRWQVELHFRTLKDGMAMGVLRCHTPAMVRKEIAMHAVVFNAVRAVMTEAGRVVDRASYRLSFTAAKEAIEAYAVPLSNPVHRECAWLAMLKLIGSQVVDDRPNRAEPRKLKRRPKDCKYMTKPRQKYPRITKASP